jgi:hypothetical protein
VTNEIHKRTPPQLPKAAFKICNLMTNTRMAPPGPPIQISHGEAKFIQPPWHANCKSLLANCEYGVIINPLEAATDQIMASSQGACFWLDNGFVFPRTSKAGGLRTLDIQHDQNVRFSCQRLAVDDVQVQRYEKRLLLYKQDLEIPVVITRVMPQPCTCRIRCSCS